MNLPILGKLKDGEKFDFATLVDNIEQTEDYFKWWWNEKASFNTICRPEVIADDDPILAETIRKDKADLVSNRELFDKFLIERTEQRVLPLTNALKRSYFRDQLIKLMIPASKAADGRRIVFAGGGYGSGKTTILSYMAQKSCLPVANRHIAGVDIFKTLIPEFNLIKAVGDGRASLTVQKECVGLADKLFETLVAAGRSFIWDSSMSAKNETLARIDKARAAGYGLSMVAVFTSLENCIHQAMHRAQETRRFPNPEALPQSHAAFLQHFTDYIPFFGEISVFENDRRLDEPLIIAEKKKGGKSLELLDAHRFNAFISSAQA